MNSDSPSIFPQPFKALGCNECRNLDALGFDFIMAFQLIVDVQAQQPFAYEALVRGVAGESAGEVLSWVNDGNRYRFDQACRVKAIEQATSLGLLELPDCLLSINFLPNAVYRAETCIRATLEAARRCGFPHERLMFEVAEGEQIHDAEHLKRIFAEYGRQGFTTAIDDFGAGYSGLNLLAEFQPQVLKLDMALTRGIDQDRVRQAIVAGIVLVAQRLGIRIIAEGIESAGERDALLDLGIRYMQGFFFARPQVDRLCLP
ncbi:MULTISPECIES: EAL domain-containing protein [unclassified Pseudomonas]|uniref:EAL domain-containing protein n=1 Tax=unclassified Pseudomonas TaxID=196821 RepID=UPI000ECC9671|nr:MULTISPECIES: EAL domain-containing protein [unclassified Pseudomonas]HBZ92535.1 EAL domain-containing protein [Pseudomonas sp.]